MAGLGNLLTLEGGVPLTGRRVKLTLALPSKDAERESGQKGLPSMVEAEILLLPVSLRRRAKAQRSADAYVEEQRANAAESTEPGAVPDLSDERIFRFLLDAMRDSEDPRKRFVDAKLVDTMRDILTYDQLLYLAKEYEALIHSEYPETIPVSDQQAIAEDATKHF